MDIPCEQCYATVRSSTQASDNLLPTATACRACHDGGLTPRSAPSPRFVARFNHSLHLKMGNLAPVISSAIDKKAYLAPPPSGLREQLNGTNPCEACHRGLRESETISKANFCAVCHGRRFTCQGCH